MNVETTTLYRLVNDKELALIKEMEFKLTTHGFAIIKSIHPNVEKVEIIGEYKK